MQAKGAEGASVSSATGVKIDSHGYAVVPYLTPYGMNTVDTDPNSSSIGVEFESTSEQSAPHACSIVMLKYKAETGRAALIRAPQVDGKALPFGAEVLDEEGRTVGVVAQDSRVFARGIADKGALEVKWGDLPGERRIDYVLAEKSSKADSAYASIRDRIACLP